MYRWILPTVFILAAAITGCSGSGLDGVTPSTQTTNRTTDSYGPQVWGLWDVEWNPSQNVFEAIPLRSAMFAVNVVKFINASDANLIIHVNAIEHKPNWVDFDLNIGFKHPFPGLAIYTGFDVMGVFMGQGSVQYPGAEGFPIAGPDDQQLLNPDGYTRRFNAPEFSGAGQILPLQGFIPGKKGTNGYVPTAVLNPYKYYADGLDSDSDAFAFLSDNGGRGSFQPGNVNYRNFKVRMPSSLLKFQYAIIANWEPNKKHPLPPANLDDFSLSANSQEAVAISVVDMSDAYYVNESTYGGDIALNITPWDWSASCSGVMEEYSIKLYSSAWTGAYDVFMTPIDSGEHRYTFSAKVPVETLTASGDFPVWVEVDYPEYDYASPIGVPNEASGQLAVYFKTQVNILDHDPSIPSGNFIYGMADSNFFTNIYQNQTLFTNMLNLPVNDPYVNNKKVMLYKGHAGPYPDYFGDFEGFVESLGYEYVFVAPDPYVPLDTTGVRMLLIGVFYGADGEYYTPEEIQTIRDFVNGGGVCIIITEFDQCYVDPCGGIDTVTQLLLGLKVGFTCPIDGDYHTDPFTDITPDPITVGVSAFWGACTGRFEVFGDGVSLIRGIDTNGSGIAFDSVVKSPLG